MENTRQFPPVPADDKPSQRKVDACEEHQEAKFGRRKDAHHRTERIADAEEKRRDSGEEWRNEIVPRRIRAPRAEKERKNLPDDQIDERNADAANHRTDNRQHPNGGIDAERREKRTGDDSPVAGEDCTRGANPSRYARFVPKRGVEPRHAPYEDSGADKYADKHCNDDIG